MVSSNWDHVALFMMGTSVTLLVFSHFQQRFVCVSLLHSNSVFSHGVLRKYKGNVGGSKEKTPKRPKISPWAALHDTSSN